MIRSSLRVGAGDALQEATSPAPCRDRLRGERNAPCLRVFRAEFVRH